MDKRIPVYIITGFLGSGKTTVLKQMVEHAKAKQLKPAILLNELGAENVEKQLFDNEEMIELLDGCICCTIQEDMKEELVAFLEKRQDIDILFIEGTGIANPIEIVEALTHPTLINKVEVHTIIGVVDSSRYLEFQSLFQSSKEIREMLKDQVKASSLLILNKKDLINEKEMKKVIERVERLKQKGVEIVQTSFGEVDKELLFLKRVQTEEWTYQKHSHEHGHHHHHDHPFQAIKLEHIPAMDKRMFEKWLKDQPKLLRAKGYIALSPDHHLFSFQFASGYLQLTPLDEKVVPCLILIGAGLDQSVVESFRNRFS
ncbi:CobW family GTP-binding protein [Bacillus suaedae]|uniref:GTP-binding protein n=1 Tax=Halalkalibacter suaedae TaxID=2822140 RepID=A0A941AP44_9BACI|nr:GTP-binding protein [Bacillus suaedae]